MIFIIKAVISLILVGAFGVSNARYEPNWESLDKRPTPVWFDEAKFGIFITWGIYAVPGVLSEWFWYYWKHGNHEAIEFMKKNYPPNFSYADFATHFTCEFFNPQQWVEVFEASGAKYIVLTTKHCDGYTLWNSSTTFGWNSVDVGPKRNLVDELVSTLRKNTDIKIGLYHALYEWFNPLYDADVESHYATRNFPVNKIHPALHELVNYFKPDLIWSDANRGPDSYWNCTGFLAWLFNESPVKDTVVINDRWCDVDVCNCKHGGYWTCQDRYNPKHLVPHKWENCMTIDKASWGFRRNADLESIMSVHELLTIFAETVSCGGNLLMNVGPTHDGRIVPIFEDRLRQFGQWLNVNGEAIYASKPWIHQNDTITSNVWYTSKRSKTNETIVYAIVLDWPEANTLVLGAPVPTAETTISMLGYKEHESFAWSKSENSLKVEFPYIPINKIPSIYAWVLKIEHLTLKQSRVIQNNRQDKTFWKEANMFEGETNEIL